MEQVAVDREHFYVLSCRKPDPALSGRARERLPLEVLTVPKRAGTYMLLRAPFDRNVQERDLVPEADADTDAGERADRPRAAQQQEAWRNWQRAAEDGIAGLLNGLGPVVLYVHGYNTKPGEALRAGVVLQEALDRHAVGATVVVFAWPSAGHLFDYFPDQKAAGRFGSYALVNLLLSLRRAAADVPISCIAHSMGSYVVTRALSTMAVLQLQTTPILSEVAYMEPDIDYDILCSGYTGPAYDSPSYLEIADGYAATALMKRLTIYCTTNDMALFASLFKNRTKRLGAYGPGLESERDLGRIMTTRVRPNVHVVNCDEWCVFDALPQHSHSHFLECPGIMADVAEVFGGRSADPMVGRAATNAPRWSRLRYRSPQWPDAWPLRAMASFWSRLGTLAVNPLAVALVKWKKRVQQIIRFAKGLVPAVLFGSTTAMAWWTRNALWRAAFLMSAAALLAYFVAWAAARMVQRREDRAP